MELMLNLIIILIITSIFTLISRKIKILPGVVGLIIAGILIGSPLLKNQLIGNNSNIIFLLGNLGLLSLMFLAGLESSWREIYKEKKDSIFIACFAFFLPLILGFLFAYFTGHSLTTSLIVGVALSITAEATKARVLFDLKKLKTRVASAMMGAGIVDDIFGFGAFLLITIFIAKSFELSEALLIVGAIVFFFLGIWFQKYLGRHHRLLKIIEEFLSWIIVPFFFVSLGLYFNFDSLLHADYILPGILIIAIIGKLGGSLLTKPFTSFKFKQLYLIGWAMNSRGAVELALALIAISMNLITPQIYSALIITALATTLVFPFIITHIIKKEPKIMN